MNSNNRINKCKEKEIKGKKVQREEMLKHTEYLETTNFEVLNEHPLTAAKKTKRER